MLTPNLQYQEALEEVSAGNELSHEKWRFNRRDPHINARHKLQALLCKSLASEKGRFKHGRAYPDFLGPTYRPLKPHEEPSYEQAEIMLSRDPYSPRLERCIQLAQLPLEIDLSAIEKLGGHPFGSHYHNVMGELFLNACDNAALGFHVDFLCSSSGFVFSTSQKGRPFDICTQYQERMALPPSVDPLGRPIERPKYWCDLGNGKGFIRGNGLFSLASDSRIQVNSQYSAERYEATIFAFGRTPFTPPVDSKLFLKPKG